MAVIPACKGARVQGRPASAGRARRLLRQLGIEGDPHNVVGGVEESTVTGPPADVALTLAAALTQNAHERSLLLDRSEALGLDNRRTRRPAAPAAPADRRCSSG